jgi:Ser/Thr protein kinase RdoA (MazF antagonist)
MPSDSIVNHFLPIAQEVCSSYGIIAVEITPLGQSENITYRVTRKEDHEHFLLRIHRSKSISTPTYTREMIKSELSWLLALSQDTSIVVQEPQVNRFGQLVTEITVPNEQSPFYCTLLRWVDGLLLENPCSALQARNLGELMAQLHNHACQ